MFLVARPRDPSRRRSSVDSLGSGIGGSGKVKARVRLQTPLSTPPHYPAFYAQAALMAYYCFGLANPSVPRSLRRVHRHVSHVFSKSRFLVRRFSSLLVHFRRKRIERNETKRNETKHRNFVLIRHVEILKDCFNVIFTINSSFIYVFRVGLIYQSE